MRVDALSSPSGPGRSRGSKPLSHTSAKGSGLALRLRPAFCQTPGTIGHFARRLTTLGAELATIAAAWM